MPATDTLVLSRFRRRLQWLGNGLEQLCVALILVSSAVTFGGICFLTYVETRPQYAPEECFDASRDCEVVSVTHVYNVSDLTCTDSFVYVWKFFSSPVLFEQVERRRRDADECFLDLDISERNATFANGTNTCFRIKPLYESYDEHFNCAPVLESNNATVGRCQTLFSPVSTYDASLVIALMSVIGFYCICQVTLYVFDEVDEEEIDVNQFAIVQPQDLENAEEDGDVREDEEGEGEHDEDDENEDEDDTGGDDDALSDDKEDKEEDKEEEEIEEEIDEQEEEGEQDGGEKKRNTEI